MKPRSNILKITTLAALASLSSTALAYSPIIRDYQSARQVAMGNVRYTTGLYEENFFANPARVTENPSNMLQLPKFTFEAGSGTLKSFKDLTAGGSGFAPFKSSVGKPLSAKVQIIPLAFYKREMFRRWSFAVGIQANAQTFGQLSQTGLVTPTTILGAGPVFTLARKLLPEDRLSIGINARAEYRASAPAPFQLLQFLRGDKADTFLRGGSGMGIDFDLGTTFRPHWGLLGMNYELAFAANNLLGGKYNQFGGKIGGWAGNPIASPRSFNFGIAARKPDLWKFKSFMAALEVTDLGNNQNGSLFRTIHLGAEAVWKVLAIRGGINQGYLCGGFGLDLLFLTLDASTYGEEMGLNAGSFEDRRYALSFGFKI